MRRHKAIGGDASFYGEGPAVKGARFVTAEVRKLNTRDGQRIIKQAFLESSSSARKKWVYWTKFKRKKSRDDCLVPLTAQLELAKCPGQKNSEKDIHRGFRPKPNVSIQVEASSMLDVAMISEPPCVCFESVTILRSLRWFHSVPFDVTLELRKPLCGPTFKIRWKN